jgi:hypothetical protein
MVAVYTTDPAGPPRDLHGCNSADVLSSSGLWPVDQLRNGLRRRRPSLTAKRGGDAISPSVYTAIWSIFMAGMGSVCGSSMCRSWVQPSPVGPVEVDERGREDGLKQSPRAEPKIELRLGVVHVVHIRSTCGRIGMVSASTRPTHPEDLTTQVDRL